MTSPTYKQTLYIAQKKAVYWTEESTTAGTAPPLTSPSWNLESCIDYAINPQEQRYEGAEYNGMPVSGLTSKRVQRYCQPTWTGPYRAGGLAERVLMRMLGDQTNAGTGETVSGTGDPYTHTFTPGIAGCRVPTFALIEDPGAGANGALMVNYATPSSISLAAASGDILRCTINFISLWHVATSAPSAATRVTPGTRMLGFQGTSTLYGSSGSAYTAVANSATLNISRQNTAPVWSIATGNIDPLDIASGVLDFNVSLDFLYDGIGAGTAYNDFMNDNKVGDSTHKHVMTWTDSDSHGFTITFYPAYWSGLNRVAQGAAWHMSGTLMPKQDETASALTFISSIAFKNATSTGMIL